MPKDVKPFKDVGSGVLEIALRYASDACRAVLAVQIGKRIYVLRAFQKKSKKALRPRSGMLTWSRSGMRKHRSWHMSTKKRKPIKFEEGSGNVFADLGLKEADQLLARAQIGYHVFKILEEKKLKQREISDILGIAQPDVSHLMNGHFSRFTTDKLLDFLKRLNRKVTIEVSRHHKGEPYQQVTFAP
jgi:predicted XRE-type DNA-binding protein